VINEAYKTGKNVEILVFHSFNWEIANAYLPTKIHYPMVTVYMPLSNKIMNRLFIHLRTKFGALLVPATNFKKNLLRLSATGMRLF